MAGKFPAPWGVPRMVDGRAATFIRVTTSRCDVPLDFSCEVSASCVRWGCRSSSKACFFEDWKALRSEVLEIGTDKDHVHFLVQSVPTYPVIRIVTLLKSLTAREIFRRCLQVKKKLWGWRVLEWWLFCKYGRQTRRWKHDCEEREKSRQKIQQTTWK